MTYTTKITSIAKIRNIASKGFVFNTLNKSRLKLKVLEYKTKNIQKSSRFQDLWFKTCSIRSKM